MYSSCLKVATKHIKNKSKRQKNIYIQILLTITKVKSDLPKTISIFATSLQGDAFY